MKEATGELNSTLIVVMAVAALATFFFTVIWPMIRSDMQGDASCRKAYCDNGIVKGESWLNCKWVDSRGKTKEIQCPYKG